MYVSICILDHCFEMYSEVWGFFFKVLTREGNFKKSEDSGLEYFALDIIHYYFWRFFFYYYFSLLFRRVTKSSIYSSSSARRINKCEIIMCILMWLVFFSVWNQISFPSWQPTKAYRVLMCFPKGYSIELVHNAVWEQLVLPCLLICRLAWWRTGQ